MRQECSDIAHQTQERTDLGCRARDGPVEDFVDLLAVRFDAPGGDVVTEEVDLEEEEVPSLLFSDSSPRSRL